MTLLALSWVFRQLVKLGVPDKWADRLAKPVLVAGLIAAGLAAMWGAKALYDHRLIERHEERRELDSIDARDGAADERARDVIGNYEMERELRDAINAAPESDTPLHPASVALGCQRLRRAGVELPPACGPDRGDGSETRSVRRDRDRSGG